MNIAIVGYGKMGHIIEQIAPSRNHKEIKKQYNGTHVSSAMACAKAVNWWVILYRVLGTKGG